MFHLMKVKSNIKKNKNFFKRSSKLENDLLFNLILNKKNINFIDILINNGNCYYIALFFIIIIRQKNIIKITVK